MHSQSMLRIAAVVGGAAAVVAVVAGCATPSPRSALDARFDEMMRASFRDHGIATRDRLHQDPANEVCSDALGKDLPADLARRIEAEGMKTIKAPSDGRYLGDWKRGEALAQSGRGMTWTDTASDTSANGGSCYNCHQLSKDETSYGTIGPSLHHYGKLRGVADPSSPGARPLIEYTWGRLWNTRAYEACSKMPRFGHAGLLSEAQLKDLMALLLDPQSPVNR